MKKRELAVEVSEDENDSQDSEKEKQPVELIPFFKPKEQVSESNSEQTEIQRKVSESNAEEILAAKILEE